MIQGWEILVTLSRLETVFDLVVGLGIYCLGPIPVCGFEGSHGLGKKYCVKHVRHLSVELISCCSAVSRTECSTRGWVIRRR